MTCTCIVKNGMHVEPEKEIGSCEFKVVLYGFV